MLPLKHSNLSFGLKVCFLRSPGNRSQHALCTSLEPGETQGTGHQHSVSLSCCTWLALSPLSSFSSWWSACCSCYKFNHQVYGRCLYSSSSPRTMVFCLNINHSVTGKAHLTLTTDPSKWLVWWIGHLSESLQIGKLRKKLSDFPTIIQ